MSKNRYVYTCKFCGKEVASLTKHYKKEHPEHVSEALSDGTQQRIAMGQSNPINNLKKKNKPVEGNDNTPKPVEGNDSTPKPKESEKPDKPGSFLDCLDDF